MAGEPDLLIFRVRPRDFRDVYGQEVDGRSGAAPGLRVPFIGKPDDPHRTLYRTLTFALPSFKPHIVHAEEEPDSLPALQILLARRLFSSRSRLILHTWQNVDRPKKAHVKMVLRITLKAAHGVLCANTEAERLLSRLGFTGPTGIIPQQGVDTDIFRPLRDDGEGRGFTAMYAGRFVREKGLDTLFEALSRVKEPVHLLLLGTGPEREELERKVRSLKGPHDGEIVSPCSQNEMTRYYARADAFILPSRSTAVWQEQFGRTLVEAMACGVPVVGSDSGAIPEVVADAGLIFRESDPVDLARCIARLMESADLRAALIGRGHLRVATMYSQEQVALKTAAFYRRIMSETG